MSTEGESIALAIKSDVAAARGIGGSGFDKTDTSGRHLIGDFACKMQGRAVVEVVRTAHRQRIAWCARVDADTVGRTQHQRSTIVVAEVVESG